MLREPSFFFYSMFWKSILPYLKLRLLLSNHSNSQRKFCNLHPMIGHFLVVLFFGSIMLLAHFQYVDGQSDPNDVLANASGWGNHNWGIL